MLVGQIEIGLFAEFGIQLGNLRGSAHRFHVIGVILQSRREIERLREVNGYIVDTGGSISSGHRPFRAIPDAAAVTVSQLRSSLLHSLKERIAAASH
jgi:high-affinity K+ transport system ATPase subunit B